MATADWCVIFILKQLNRWFHPYLPPPPPSCMYVSTCMIILYFLGIVLKYESTVYKLIIIKLVIIYYNKAPECSAKSIATTESWFTIFNMYNNYNKNNTISNSISLMAHVNVFTGSDPETCSRFSGSAVHDAPKQSTFVIAAQVTVLAGQGQQQHVVVGGSSGHRV